MIDIYTPKEVINYAKMYAYGRTKFCSWLEIVEDDEIMERVFAFRQKKNKELEIIEVIRRSSNDDKTFYKSLGFVQFGYYSYFVNEEFDITYKDLNLSTIILNINILKNTQYKYLKFNIYDSVSIIKVIRLYKQFPTVEFFLKLDLPLSKKMLKLAENDKSFRKYLFRLNLKNIYFYVNSQDIIYSYNHNCSLFDSRNFFALKRQIFEYELTKYDFIEKNLEKIIKYLIDKNISVSNFKDYINACVYLKLNMTLNKNLYPHDFMRMHDLRINEYDSLKEKVEAKSRRKFYKDFKTISQKYKFLEYEKDYLLKIASSVQSLKHEGRLLCHCVGRMGYDKKMIDEKSLIFFIRNKERPDIPFVTLEYDLNNNKILQIYGKNDSDPPENVLTFANHWCKLANNRLKKFIKNA